MQHWWGAAWLHYEPTCKIVSVTANGAALRYSAAMCGTIYNDRSRTTSAGGTTDGLFLPLTGGKSRALTVTI